MYRGVIFKECAETPVFKGFHRKHFKNKIEISDINNTIGAIIGKRQLVLGSVD